MRTVPKERQNFVNPDEAKEEIAETLRKRVGRISLLGRLEAIGEEILLWALLSGRREAVNVIMLVPRIWARSLSAISKT